jgi:hypothetical protein
VIIGVTAQIRTRHFPNTSHKLSACVDGRTMLKCILKFRDMTVWAEFSLIQNTVMETHVFRENLGGYTAWSKIQ